MRFIVKDTSVVIETDNHKVELSKKNFNKEILNEEILNDLSFNDLLNIWKSLYGVPKNIKDVLIKKIELYSSSSNVNSFIYNDKEYWLDKNNRNCLWNISNSSMEDVEFIVGEDIITLNPLKLKSFLLKLEVYAYKCHVNTFKHLKQAKTLSEFGDIINYDYTKGYPTKLTFNV